MIEAFEIPVLEPLSCEIKVFEYKPIVMTPKRGT
jgi:hypothetical protein